MTRKPSTSVLVVTTRSRQWQMICCPGLQADPQLGRFWAHRGEDGVKREKQLLIDFLCTSSGGPMYYCGRDMVLTHRGMRISESDWNAFLGHAPATLAGCPRPNSATWSRLSGVSSKRSSSKTARGLFYFIFSISLDSHVSPGAEFARIASPQRNSRRGGGRANFLRRFGYSPWSHRVFARRY
jgi:hypothetical protein